MANAKPWRPSNEYIRKLGLPDEATIVQRIDQQNGDLLQDLPLVNSSQVQDAYRHLHVALKAYTRKNETPADKVMEFRKTLKNLGENYFIAGPENRKVDHDGDLSTEDGKIPYPIPDAIALDCQAFLLEGKGNLDASYFRIDFDKGDGGARVWETLEASLGDSPEFDNVRDGMTKKAFPNKRGRDDDGRDAKNKRKEGSDGVGQTQDAKGSNEPAKPPQSEQGRPVKLESGGGSATIQSSYIPGAVKVVDEADHVNDNGTLRKICGWRSLGKDKNQLAVQMSDRSPLIGELIPSFMHKFKLFKYQSLCPEPLQTDQSQEDLEGIGGKPLHITSIISQRVKEGMRFKMPRIYIQYVIDGEKTKRWAEYQRLLKDGKTDVLPHIQKIRTNAGLPVIWTPALAWEHGLNYSATRGRSQHGAAPVDPVTARYMHAAYAQLAHNKASGYAYQAPFAQQVPPQFRDGQPRRKAGDGPSMPNTWGYPSNPVGDQFNNGQYYQPYAVPVPNSYPPGYWSSTQSDRPGAMHPAQNRSPPSQSNSTNSTVGDGGDRERSAFLAQIQALSQEDRRALVKLLQN